jgi:hypothetical protein
MCSPAYGRFFPVREFRSCNGMTLAFPKIESARRANERLWRNAPVAERHATPGLI